MDTLLVEGWLEGAPSMPVLDGASTAVVREAVRARAAEVGLPGDATERLANVASELATNHLAHAKRGEMALVAVERDGARGLELRAADYGPGIADAARAFRGGTSTAGTMGVGLAAVLELADEVDVDTRIDEGTCICARVYERRLARTRELGLVSAPIKGEHVSGDDALVRRLGGGVVAIVLDGLGHGPLAREAAVVAKRTAAGMLDRSPEDILAACHTAAARTRGVAMTVARIEPDGTVRVAGVGNVAAYLVGPKAVRRFGGLAGVVGAPGPLRRRAAEEMQMGPLDALLMHTDGMSARWPDDERQTWPSEVPVVIAASLLQRYASGNDDALALVVR